MNRSQPILMILVLSVLISVLIAAEGETPIRLFTPTGWMLEVRPNGSGTLTWLEDPFPAATARPYTFNYLVLHEELKGRPKGDSKYHYAFGISEAAEKISAPKESEFLHKTLKKAARILYSHNTKGFYKARITNPIFAKDRIENQ